MQNLFIYFLSKYNCWQGHTCFVIDILQTNCSSILFFIYAILSQKLSLKIVFNLKSNSAIKCFRSTCGFQAIYNDCPQARLTMPRPLLFFSRFYLRGEEERQKQAPL